MALHREQKALAARFEALEEVRAAKTDQPSAGAVEIVEDAFFFVRSAFLSIGLEIVRQPVARQR